ncbi:Cell envelope-associated transcriptional attenuator LytR-CpsA-Psr [Serinicoccus hydrothermalis]|uniref:Cell envelope-associated transcriptional attenuator LytR-CpsA-Psr n=1 Tax=Serinicoccus hydrothermalis TaxID=1758689 RepID=A0A1B1NF16_9MICO|nr:LCP family protein [Serinicoccus hydrothermalis]ANS79993.1 Cell envelope-associated transcriptional attenuator LytR-CpsA-Psr [Serinicoccus hydrothermalis]
MRDDHTPGGGTPDRRRRRPLRLFAAGIGVLALVGVLALGGYAFFLQRTVEGNIEREDLNAQDDSTVTISPDRFGSEQPEDSEADAEDPEGSVDLEGTVETEEESAAPIVGEDGQAIEVGESEFQAETPERPAEAGEAQNFLIIGSDSRDLSVERGRSDVIVLMHINDERDRVDLIHFPRDLFVPIAGTGGSSKINAAYSYGGAPLLVQTLQPLVDVPIDHVVVVNFQSFQAMTDAIGGVDVDVAESSPGFPEGVMHMDGATGLEFVRERYALSQGDISRGQRQQAFIQGIMTKALSRETLTNPARLASFVDAATTNLTVDADLQVGDMRDLGFQMRGVRGDDIHFETAPWTGIANHPVAGSIVVMADDQMADLSEHLRNDTMEDYTDPVSPRSGFGG